MFEQTFTSSYYITRHAAAPYAKERDRYLTACAERGDSKRTLITKADELFWVACRLAVYRDLHVTLDQVRAAALDCDWKDREHVCGRKLRRRATGVRFIMYARQWLRFLGYLPRPAASIPFVKQLDEYCRWAREEKGLAEASIKHRFFMVGRFLRWYGNLGRTLSEVRIVDIDAYLARCGEQGWRRSSVSQAAATLRVFFRFCGSKGWVHPSLADAIYGPRLYTLETLPAGPTWPDVKRIFAGLGAHSPTDIRDRAILMLFATYGFRKREVASLCLEHLDWDHGLLHVTRTKRRETQIYPLLPSVGNAIAEYLKKVRRPRSPHRQVFLTMVSPYSPLSPSAFYRVAATKLKAIGVRTAHYGPHSLRHACATRLVSKRFSLKEIGDHLGHHSTSATRVYAKVDLPGLREVSAFDLGDVI